MSHVSEMQKTLEDLIRFQTIETNTDALRDCANYIADFFKDTNLTITRLEREGVPSVVVTKEDAKNVTVCFNGHFDVVGAKETQFTPRVEGDKLYGRGAMDMKSGVAVMMHLMRDLADTEHSISAMFVGDEEVGGNHGTKLVLEQGFESDVLILPDGGETIDKVVIKEKGLIFLDIAATGKAYHGSRPWRGENAIEKLMQAFQNMKPLFPALEEHPEDHWVRTFNIGKIHGGIVRNQVPAEVTAECDIRFPGHEKAEDILKEIEAVLPEGVTLVNPRVMSPGVDINAEHPMIAAYGKAMQSIGREATFLATHGRSDAAFFGDTNTVVIQGQPDGAGLHSENEWVSIPALEQYYKVLKTFVDDVAI